MKLNNRIKVDFNYEILKNLSLKVRKAKFAKSTLINIFLSLVTFEIYSRERIKSFLYGKFKKMRFCSWLWGHTGKRHFRSRNQTVVPEVMSYGKTITKLVASPLFNQRWRRGVESHFRFQNVCVGLKATFFFMTSLPVQKQNFQSCRNKFSYMTSLPVQKQNFQSCSDKFSYMTSHPIGNWDFQPETDLALKSFVVTSLPV